MSKSVRISDKAYQQVKDLQAAGYESFTNVIAVAVDRLHRELGGKEMKGSKFYQELLSRARKMYTFNGGQAGRAARAALDQAHAELSQRQFFNAIDALGGSEAIEEMLVDELENPWRGEKIWLVSGNRDRETGEYKDAYAIPLNYLPDDGIIVIPGIARLSDNEVDGARKWAVVADDGQEAYEMVAAMVTAARSLDPDHHVVAGVDTRTIPEARAVARDRWGDFIQGNLPVHGEGCPLTISARDEAIISGLCDCPRLTIFSDAEHLVEEIKQ
jgi:predicted CopG family antitoxin